MSTESIYNFLRVDERILTGGQPTEAQLKDAADEGIQAVVNLATLDPRYSLADEAGLVRSLGLAYHHIPVDWEKPEAGDFEAFARLMASLSQKRVLIHCAANYRVTAFYSLYAQKALGWTADQAAALRARVWRGQHPVWDDFIRAMTENIAGEAGSGASQHA